MSASIYSSDRPDVEPGVEFDCPCGCGKRLVRCASCGADWAPGVRCPFCAACPNGCGPLDPPQRVNAVEVYAYCPKCGHIASERAIGRTGGP